LAIIKIFIFVLTEIVHVVCKEEEEEEEEKGKSE